MRLFGIEIGVGLNSSGFSAGLDNCKRQLKSFASSIGGQFAAYDIAKRVAGIIKDALLSGIEAVKTVKIGSLKMGVDKKTFQEISNSLEAAGSDAEQFDKGLLHIAEAMEKAKGTGEEAAKARKEFAVFGVTLDDINQKGRHRIFSQMADDLRSAAQAGELTEAQLSALKAILGKGALDLIPFMVRGTKASDLAGVFSDEELKRLEKARDASVEMKSIWKDMKVEAGLWGGAISEALQTVYNDLSEIGWNKHRSEDLTPAEKAVQASNEAKFHANEKKKAQDKADNKNAEDETQARREHIAELDFAEQANKDKLLTKEERLAKLAEKRAELMATIAKLDQFVGPQKPLEKEEKRAEIREKISELEVESNQLDKGSKLRQPHAITALQQIGAQINGPLVESDAQRRTAQNTENINRVAAAILEAMKRAPNNDIRRNDPFA